MAFISKFRTAATKAETTPGSGVLLSGADANVRMFDLAIGSLNVEMDGSNKAATGDYGRAETVPGPQSAQITFNTKFWSENTDEPAWTKFAKSSGCQVASGVGHWMVYPSKLAVENTMTIGVYDSESIAIPSGLHYDFVGCIGNCTINADGVGKPYSMQWEYTGGLNDIKDIAYASIPVYSGSTASPDRFLNGTATIGGVSVCISSLEFNFGNTVSPLPCQSSASGYKQYILTDAEPKLKINPLLKRNSEMDFWNKWTTGVIEEIIISTAQFELRIPRAQIISAGVEDSDGVLRTGLEFAALRPTSAGTYNYASWELRIKNKA